jgi:hypothetical protein
MIPLPQAINVGHWPVTTADQALAMLRRLGVRHVRFMNWLRAYTWSGPELLTPDDDWHYRPGPWANWHGHVPLAVCLDLVDAVGLEGAWFNLPYALRTRALREGVALIAERMAGRRWWIATGCEAWNTAGPYAAQHAWFGEAGRGDALAGYRSRCELLSRIVGEAGGTLVLECHTMNPAVARTLLAGDFRSPVALGIAPYFGRKRLSGSEEAAELRTLMRSDLLGPVRDGIAQHGELAAQVGVPLVAYEAGHHLVGQSEAMEGLARQRLIGRYYALLHEVWQVAGGSEIFWYRLSGAAGGGGEHWDFLRMERGEISSYLA